MARYLTKSKYKTALECPRKLWYQDRPNEYENNKLDDPFLKALARGGFQVGELAKLYYPCGVQVKSLNHKEAVKQTNELLKKENVIIYEAAFLFNNLFVRVDVLKKVGQNIQLIEVKSKSFDPTQENPFYDKTVLKQGHTKLLSSWRPYLYDIAFQTFVCQKERPEFHYTPYLMLSDKSKRASVDGLNQLFFLYEENGRTKVKVNETANLERLGEKILIAVNVKDTVELILDGRDNGKSTRQKSGVPSFEDEIHFYAKSYTSDVAMDPRFGSGCKNCEFRAGPNSSLKSGFNECWQKFGNISSEDCKEPFVFDIWNFRKAGSLIRNGIFLAKDLDDKDLSLKETDKAGMSPSERQKLQIDSIKLKSLEPEVDVANLRSEMDSWSFPLHFIDFETTMVAIPFNKGRRPYEQIAFQFSHHTVDQNGRVEHKGEYIDYRQGSFPNFDFVRALRHELSSDQGTVFRYAAHENTVLCQIYEQLGNSSEPDKEELRSWIRTLTCSTETMTEEWLGERSMVDLCDLVKRYYYHPCTNGSNSIKKVLPVTLYESSFLKERYSKPIYGSKDGIPSKNFFQKTWLELDKNGTVIDPYKQLPPIFQDIDTDKLDFTLVKEDELADGGAAMTAYAMMQFTEMSLEERESLKAALLKYCELDTLAMVMIYEYWAYEVCGRKVAA